MFIPFATLSPWSILALRMRLLSSTDNSIKMNGDADNDKVFLSKGIRDDGISIPVPVVFIRLELS